MRDNEELMNGLRQELRRAVGQRFKRIELDRFKAEIKDHVTHYVFEHTQRSPIVIPVVNIVGAKGEKNGKQGENSAPQKSNEEIVAEQQKRFQDLRAKLLNQDPRTD